MKQQIFILIFGLLLLSGIILAGSDGTLFPWPNILGLLLAASAVFISRKLNGSLLDIENTGFQKGPQNHPGTGGSF